MFSFLFSPYGRVSRQTYWLNWILPYVGVSFMAGVLDTVMFPPNPGTGEPQAVFQGFLSLFFFWPSIAVATKRLHDRGMTGWWNVAAYLAVAALAAIIYSAYKVSLRGAEPFAGPVAKINAVVVVAVSVWVIGYLLVNTLFLKGKSGPNKYGPDPLGDPADVFQ